MNKLIEYNKDQHFFCQLQIRNKLIICILQRNNKIYSHRDMVTYKGKNKKEVLLGRHTSSRETRLVSREIQLKSLTPAVTFTTDQVTKGIISCRNTRVFGPDKLSTFHLKHLRSRGIEYLPALFNASVTSCRILSIWKSSIVIPTPKPGKYSSRSISYQHISLLCPATKVQLSYFQPSTTTCLHPQTNTVPDPDTLPLLLCYN